MHADTTLNEAAGKPYDMIFLPGGPGTLNLRGDLRVRELVQKQFSDGRWLAAICAAPTVLNDAGLLQGRRYTAHTSVEKELGHVLTSERVVVDGKIITSRGAGTALDFGLKLVEELVSPAKAREIAAAICA
jgi:4-methyl-5(b-hydroxyethyl)-thiazole monophosphate biosynthesis